MNVFRSNYGQIIAVFLAFFQKREPSEREENLPAPVLLPPLCSGRCRILPIQYLLFLHGAVCGGKGRVRDAARRGCGKAKGGEDIAVPLNDFAKDILRTLCGKDSFPKAGPIFVRRGVQMQNVRKTMDEVCRRCGIENLHIHDLRRSLGSWMLMNGVDIAVVSRTLGHKSIAVTEKVYAHLLPGKISSATQSAVTAMRDGKIQ